MILSVSGSLSAQKGNSQDLYLQFSGKNAGLFMKIRPILKRFYQE